MAWWTVLKYSLMYGDHFWITLLNTILSLANNEWVSHPPFNRLFALRGIVLVTEQWNTLFCWCWWSNPFWSHFRLHFRENVQLLKNDYISAGRYPGNLSGTFLFFYDTHFSNSPIPQEHRGARSAANAVRLKLQTHEATQATGCATWAEKQKSIKLKSMTERIFHISE